MTVESVENVSRTEPLPVTEKETVNNTAVKTPSPAQDLRDIQNLLVSGVFQGNMAPAVCKAYQLLEQMAIAIETSKETK
jgi:hypothetical protein